MKRQGIAGRPISHARKLTLLAATALVALAVPAAADAATTISAEYDSGEDTVFVYVDDDNTDSNVTVTGSNTTTISVGGVQSTGDSYCNGGGTAVCTFAADDYVVLIASLGG